ncbi:CBN-NAS-31 protein [Aphelenchoides avenae]|nr:CBN-NAS-31 protein [Aphelenchus avenae]
MQAAAEKHNAAKPATDDDDDEKPLHPSIPNINKPIADLLVGGDILITEEQAQALGRADGGARRRKRVPVVWEPEMKWPTNTPICYYFDNQLSASTKDLIRWTVNWWTNNSCVSWQEGCATKPRVQFVKGDGCYSGAGRYHWDPEQQVSIGEGCQLFHIVAHEVAHTLGYFHEQSRPDRDTAIKVHYELVDDPYQFDIQTQALTYVPYDYGSNMQYGGYAGDKIVMESLEKGFQHTMGSGRGPMFYDIKSMSDHYGCYAKCTNNCKNKGIPHPRDCSRCVCPEGFGGKDCSERAAADGP